MTSEILSLSSRVVGMASYAAPSGLTGLAGLFGVAYGTDTRGLANGYLAPRVRFHMVTGVTECGTEMWGRICGE